MKRDNVGSPKNIVYGTDKLLVFAVRYGKDLWERIVENVSHQACTGTRVCIGV